MQSMPVRDGLGTPKPAIRISWEEWHYLMLATLREPNMSFAVAVIAWLYDNAAWADDRVILPIPQDPWGKLN